jgi:hypothetical protein
MSMSAARCAMNSAGVLPKTLTGGPLMHGHHIAALDSLPHQILDGALPLHISGNRPLTLTLRSLPLLTRIIGRQPPLQRLRHLRTQRITKTGVQVPAFYLTSHAASSGGSSLSSVIASTSLNSARSDEPS